MQHKMRHICFNLLESVSLVKIGWGIIENFTVSRTEYWHICANLCHTGSSRWCNFNWKYQDYRSCQLKQLWIKFLKVTLLLRRRQWQALLRWRRTMVIALWETIAINPENAVAHFFLCGDGVVISNVRCCCNYETFLTDTKPFSLLFSADMATATSDGAVSPSVSLPAMKLRPQQRLDWKWAKMDLQVIWDFFCFGLFPLELGFGLYLAIKLLFDANQPSNSFWSGNCHRIWVGWAGRWTETLLEPAK